MKAGSMKSGIWRKNLSLELDLIQDNLPALVIPKLWVGSLHAACNVDVLRKNGITHVLNISGEQQCQYTNLFNYLTIDLRDKNYSNLLSCIPAANIFIRAGLTKGGVLVHCRGGRSRSPALIIAFLMKDFGKTLYEAFKLVECARPVIAINKGFALQLVTYEKCSLDIFRAQQVVLKKRADEIAISRKNDNFKSHQSIFKSLSRTPVKIELFVTGSTSMLFFCFCFS
eukprot:GSMAST32.ASY1.ANO1.1074.1 assembled CDS